MRKKWDLETNRELACKTSKECSKDDDQIWSLGLSAEQWDEIRRSWDEITTEWD